MTSQNESTKPQTLSLIETVNSKPKTKKISRISRRCFSRPANLLKRLQHRCFPVSIEKFLRSPFSQNTSRRLLLNTDIKL